MIKYDEMYRKTAIVTGGGDGCGKAIVKALYEQGCNVYILGNNLANIKSLAEEDDLNGINLPMLHYKYCDVANSSDIKKVMDDIIHEEKEIHYLINNAGISEVDFIPKIREHHYDRIMEVNAKGTFLMIQVVASLWISNKQKGSIVNVVSESAFSFHTMGMSYNASKAAQNAISKTAARELIKYGIRVNSVHPSIVEGTNLTKYLNEQFKKEYDWDEETARKMYLSKIPAGRFCKVEDVAKAVLWLLSNESEFVIGTDLMVSGGQSI